MEPTGESLKPDVVDSELPVPLADALDGDSQELWLLRVPRHSVLRQSLVGKEILLDDEHALNPVRGSYYFRRTTGSSVSKRIRPVVVNSKPGGEREFVVGPAFSRHVDVTFNGAAMERVGGGSRANSRAYPEPPSVLTGKFYPIGASEPGVGIPEPPSSSQRQATPKAKKGHPVADRSVKKKRKTSNSRSVKNALAP